MPEIREEYRAPRFLTAWPFRKWAVWKLLEFGPKKGHKGELTTFAVPQLGQNRLSHYLMWGYPFAWLHHELPKRGLAMDGAQVRFR